MDRIDSLRSSAVAPAPRVAAPRRSRRALWLPVLVALVTIGLIAWSAWPTLRPVQTVSVVQASFTAEPIDNPPTIEASAAESERTVQAPGWLEAEPFYTACTSLINGVVARVNVLEGEHVTAGQVVAQLVDDDAKLALRLAEAELASAKAGLGIARAELAAAQTGWDEPVETERAVESGRAAVAEAEAELAQLPSLIAGARAQSRRYTEEHRRYTGLGPSGAVTEMDVIETREQAAEAAARVTSLEQRRPILEAKLAMARAELKAAQRNMELRSDERQRLDAARAAVDRAESIVAAAEVDRDNAALRLERTIIRAPISGYVTQRHVVPGGKVMLGADEPHSAHVLHLYDPERLQVRVDVPLADVAHIRLGQRCEVVVEVLPDEMFVGEVLRVTHAADLQKNTLEVKVKVIDPSPLLRPDMLTRVKFLADREASPRPGASRGLAVRVPEEAIDGRDGTDRVWVVSDRRGDRGTVRQTSVERGEIKGAWASVSGSLRPGDLLVVDYTKVEHGQRVRFNATSQRSHD